VAGLDEIAQRLETVKVAHRFDFDRWVLKTSSEAHLSDVSERANAVVTLPESAIAEWLLLCRLHERLECKGIISEILRAVYRGDIPISMAEASFRAVHFRSVIRAVNQEVLRLPNWTGERMAALRERLVKLDTDYISASRTRLAWMLSRAPVPEGISRGSAGELTQRALLEREIGKQKRHIPLRQLLSRADEAIHALKPCFMMSPASVAQYLVGANTKFDLVVIDEASQMRPEEAIGALARGKQAVVVGDPKQLPPTSFFDSNQDNDLSNSSEDQVDVDTESVLDQALSAWRPSRELNWHYRSRHDSLIAFSNREFYGDRLIVFPSPTERSDNYGVQLIAVKDAIYKSSINEHEVNEILSLVSTLVRTQPDKSIAIVTMNQPQRDLLKEKFDRLAVDDSAFEEYQSKWKTERDGLEEFMIKNLENVQGDERDIVVISTVYGPAEVGGPVAQRFGPINSKVGHRRLNVLFTRAKERVVLVSSLTPEQIVVDSGSSPGVVAFKGYLEYARSGRLERGTSTGGSYDSPFEAEVAETIRELGHKVECQIGVAGYFLDLAIRHPQKNNYFMLGVECDGATYHSAKSARDRDRLRQQVLENLGWKLYRIWSTDWYLNRPREIQRLSARIEQAAKSRD
jgi:very-short-patch-repair endonuclease